MNNNYLSLNDIKSLDEALYETIDSIIYANTSEWDNKDLWLLDEKTVWIARYLEQKLSTNPKFMLKYYAIVKKLYSNMDASMMFYMGIVSAFFDINMFRHKNGMPRTLPKHSFLIFLNRSDSIESKKQKIDMKIYLERSNNMKINEFFESCERYYKQFSTILSE